MFRLIWSLGYTYNSIVVMSIVCIIASIIIIIIIIITIIIVIILMIIIIAARIAALRAWRFVPAELARRRQRLLRLGGLLMV